MSKMKLSLSIAFLSLTIMVIVAIPAISQCATMKTGVAKQKTEQKDQTSNISTQYETEDTYHYNYNIKYRGKFKSKRAYLYNEADEIWQDFLPISHFKCFEAKSTLTTTGRWIGNISDDGECLGSEEAPEWTLGNFLNFESTTSK